MGKLWVSRVGLIQSAEALNRIQGSAPSEQEGILQQTPFGSYLYLQLSWASSLPAHRADCGLTSLHNHISCFLSYIHLLLILFLWKNLIHMICKIFSPMSYIYLLKVALWTHECQAPLPSWVLLFIIRIKTFIFYGCIGLKTNVIQARLYSLLLILKFIP